MKGEYVKLVETILYEYNGKKLDDEIQKINSDNQLLKAIINNRESDIVKNYIERIIIKGFFNDAQSVNIETGLDFKNPLQILVQIIKKILDAILKTKLISQKIEDDNNLKVLITKQVSDKVIKYATKYFNEIKNTSIETIKKKIENL